MNQRKNNLPANGGHHQKSRQSPSKTHTRGAVQRQAATPSIRQPPSAPPVLPALNPQPDTRSARKATAEHPPTIVQLLITMVLFLGVRGVG